MSEPARKPLAVAPAMEAMEPYPLRLRPATIALVKVLAAAAGLQHTSFARECLLTGLSMKQGEALVKEHSRATA